MAWITSFRSQKTERLRTISFTSAQCVYLDLPFVCNISAEFHPTKNYQKQQKTYISIEDPKYLHLPLKKNQPKNVG